MLLVSLTRKQKLGKALKIMHTGYLYIISNRSWPGWIKIGTTKNLKTRLQTYQTGSPFRDYEILYSIKHPDYLKAEKNIKIQMAHFDNVNNVQYKNTTIFDFYECNDFLV